MNIVAWLTECFDYNACRPKSAKLFLAFYIQWMLIISQRSVLFFLYINKSFSTNHKRTRFWEDYMFPKGENETPQYVFLKLIVIQNKLQCKYSIPPRILNIWNIWQNESLAFSFQITFSSHFTFAMFADRLRQNGFRKHILLFYLHFVP